MTVISNLQKNTGKSLEEWIAMVKANSFEKHKEIIDWLKNTHGLTYGFANLIAHKSKDSANDTSEKDVEELINQQYVGKEKLKSIYDYLLSKIMEFGKDIEVAPKKTYVSLRRKKQFSILNPATKSRFELGINLKGQEPEDILLAEKPGSMCSHKILLSTVEDADQCVLNWIKKAYDNAG
ncbi:Predicted transport protein [Algoriphagus faecimaris]|uniref:Predicted transport protein n=1 Tax=Algoriphagus faecimaris TaxID=686796 RepID=A0A1G6WYY6_9BACT|nr:DUF4287 domain-containing protein [Algoriphagus faecimaris]SDD71180.1 Predicted transport protein [Algoriphagus faecimaris]